MQGTSRIKLGEVFQVHTNEVILVCSRCGEEFKYFTEFALHAQEHLQQLWGQRKKHIVLQINENIVDNDDFVTETTPPDPFDQPSTSIEAVTIAETSSIWIKSEIIDDEANVDGIDTDIWLENPIKSEVLSGEQPIRIIVKSENTAEDEETSRYYKLIEDFQASTSNTHSLLMLNKLRARATPCKLADTPETRMLANLFINASKYSNVCPICGTSCATITSLKNHIFTHCKAPLFQCPFCASAIQIPTSFPRHSRTHLDNRFECYLCEGQFKDFYAVRDHVRRIHVSPTYCIQCNKQFGRTRYFRKHMKDKHSKEADRRNRIITVDYRLGGLPKRTISSWQCYLCRKKFISRTGFFRHIGIHMQCGVLCSICGRQFKTQFYLTRHMNIHNKNRSYACDLCDKTYTARVYLLEHRKKKHNLYAGASCRICSATFERHLDRTEHMRTAHSKDERQFRCSICDLVSTTARQLKVHMKVHSTELVECSICQKKLRPASVELHMRMHTENGSYKCDVCDKIFQSRRNLRSHSIIHDKANRPVFKCDICEKTFFVHTKCQLHRRMHTEPMPFICKYCNLGFLLFESHRKHEVMHERQLQEQQSTNL